MQGQSLTLAGVCAIKNRRPPPLLFPSQGIGFANFRTAAQAEACVKDWSVTAGTDAVMAAPPPCTYLPIRPFILLRRGGSPIPASSPRLLTRARPCRNGRYMGGASQCRWPRRILSRKGRLHPSVLRSPASTVGRRAIRLGFALNRKPHTHTHKHARARARAPSLVRQQNTRAVRSACALPPPPTHAQ